MRGCFREFDVNGDGTIDRAELDNVFKSLGKQFSQAELDRMISLADKDKSGTIDYEEFVKQVFGWSVVCRVYVVQFSVSMIDIITSATELKHRRGAVISVDRRGVDCV